MRKKTKILYFSIATLILLVAMTELVIGPPPGVGPIYLDPGDGGGGTPPDTTPPPKVTGVYAVGVSYTEIMVYWDVSTASDCSYYNVYRNNVLIGGTSNRYDTEFCDSGLQPGVSYTYEVTAVDLALNEAVKSNPWTEATWSPSLQAIKLFNEYVSDNKDSWTSDYINWMNTYRFSQSVSGKYRGNAVNVVLQPRGYMNYLGQYELVYDLCVRAESGTGDTYEDFQPFLGDFDEVYTIPAPMRVNEVEITTTLLPNDGEKALLHESTELKIDGALQQSFIGNYLQEILGSSTLQNLIDDPSDGKFYNPTDSANWWTCMGEEFGEIRFDGPGHENYGLLITNENDNPMCVMSPTITKTIDGSNCLWYSLTVNFWGKRSSNSPYSDVGVKVIVTYTDGTIESFFPDELQIKERDSVWRPYQYTINTEKRIASLIVKVLNNEQGAAWFDQIYATEGKWKLNKYGDWDQGVEVDTYEIWTQNMLDTMTFNAKLDFYEEIIGHTDILAKIPGLGWWSKATGVAKFLLNFLEKDVPENEIQGQHPDKFSLSWLFDHTDLDWIFDGTQVEDGYTLATNDIMRVRYDIDSSDFDNYPEIGLQIDIKVWWGSCGEAEDLGWATPYDTVDYAEISFYVPICGLIW
ncbi:MAG: hypothetical protein FK733_15660 [Asgard group archaeon]|nr:hypothetical protein [Asgard group archaeon]